MQRSETKLRPILVVLAITQLIGWGTVSLPAVIGEQLARDLGLALPAVFAGTTTMLVATGLTAPLMGSAFVKFGARPVMAAGSLTAAPGFLLIAGAHGPLVYYAGWVVLGIAGAAMLSTATYILLNEIVGSAAKRPIGALMLVTGLSSSLFWPITAALTGQIGWRATLVVYSVMMVTICFPLHFFCLPQRERRLAEQHVRAAAARATSEPGRLTFVLLVLAITVHGFVGWGLGAVIIQLFKSMGMAPDWALRIGSLLGVVQVSARGLDYVGGGRWSGLATGLAAGFVIPIGILTLLLGGPDNWSIALFMLLYGGGGGAMAVARATMPLVFYDQAAYARASSRIALPSSFAAAASPPIMAAVLLNFGSTSVLLLALACSLLALVMLLCLTRVHRKATQAAVAGS